MSRDLNINQKKMIIEEVKRNISQGNYYQIDEKNHYEISTNTYFKCMKLNEHETFYQNVENYLYELKNLNLHSITKFDELHNLNLEVSKL